MTPHAKRIFCAALCLLPFTAVAQQGDQVLKMPTANGYVPSVQAAIGKHAAMDAEDESMSESVQAQLPQVQTKGDASYISGGVGEGERAAILRMSRDFNLKLEMADKGGEYISDANVVIRKQGNEILNVTPDGPLMFVKLPAGTYQISATHEGNAKQQTVTVGSSMKKVNFYW